MSDKHTVEDSSPMSFSTPFFHSGTISDFIYSEHLDIKESRLIFKNKKNKTIELSFSNDDIRFAFKGKFRFVSLQKLSTIPRDFKVVKYHFYIDVAYSKSDRHTLNHICTISKPVPLSNLVASYNEFLTKHRITSENKIILP